MAPNNEGFRISVDSGTTNETVVIRKNRNTLEEIELRALL
jgi:hypothetical protein